MPSGLSDGAAAKAPAKDSVGVGTVRELDLVAWHGDQGRGHRELHDTFITHPFFHHGHSLVTVLLVLL